MKNPEKNIPRVLVAVMVSVTILDALMMLVTIGISGQHLAGYSTPLANAFGTAIGKWGYSLIIVGMLVSIFGVAFSASFNTPSLVASLANEHGMLPKFFWKGKQARRAMGWDPADSDTVNCLFYPKLLIFGVMYGAGLVYSVRAFKFSSGQVYSQ